MIGLSFNGTILSSFINNFYYSHCDSMYGDFVDAIANHFFLNYIYYIMFVNYQLSFHLLLTKE